MGMETDELKRKRKREKQTHRGRQIMVIYSNILISPTWLRTQMASPQSPKQCTYSIVSFLTEQILRNYLPCAR